MGVEHDVNLRNFPAVTRVGVIGDTGMGCEVVKRQTSAQDQVHAGKSSDEARHRAPPGEPSGATTKTRTARTVGIS